MSKMTILDTISKQKAELILIKHGIHNKQEFIERLKVLEDIKHNYNIFQRELEVTTKEYRKYNKLINNYHKVIDTNNQPNKKNPKR